MNYNQLLSEPMKTKPKSHRASRQTSSATPPKVLRLHYNESHYGMSPKVKETFLKCVNSSHIYQDWFAIELKEALSQFYGVDKTCILPTAGSSALIDMIGAIFINPGDEVIFGYPTFEAFRDMAHDYGGIPVPIRLDESFCFDLDAIYHAITSKTKIIVICNPNNPTGTFIESSKIEAFIRKLPENIIVVVDEAYLDFVEAKDCYSMVKMIREGYEKPLIVLKTFSKIYGMASLRVGYGITQPGIIDELSKSAHAWNVSQVGQKCAIAAISDQEFIMDVKQKNNLSRQYVQKELEALGCQVIPSQTNFIYFLSSLKPEILTQELAQRDIRIGTFAYNRISLGTMEMNQRFIAAMKDIFQKK